jgi:hypothetical protein
MHHSVLPLLQERLEAAEAARFERAFHHSSKRYAKDEREVRATAVTVCS